MVTFSYGVALDRAKVNGRPEAYVSQGERFTVRIINGNGDVMAVDDFSTADAAAWRASEINEALGGLGHELVQVRRRGRR